MRGRPWGQEHLDALLAAPSYHLPVKFCMSAGDYADVRKFGRDVLEIETSPALWRTGLQAHYAGVPIYTMKEIPKFRLELQSYCGETLSSILLSEDNSSSSLEVSSSSHPEVCGLCLVQSVLCS